jgi:hypothetical protein
MALGLSDNHGAPAVPPEVERKTVTELEEYLLGRAEARPPASDGQ